MSSAPTSSPVSRRYRHAIVGTGGIARLHAEAVQQLSERAELVAGVDVDAGRAEEFCDQWQIPHRYGSLSELLGDQEVDVVHLCTPPGVHTEQAVEVLQAGANVLCEKPPTLSLAELDEIASVEDRSTGRFGTVFQHRFGSAGRNLRALASAAELGKPLVGVCNTLWYRPDSYFDVPWRGLWATEGGGPTMGHGIHQFDLLLSVLGPWREVTAVAARQARPTNTEDVSSAVVTFDNGAVATIINSVVSPRETSYLRFDFEYATVEVEHLYGYSDQNWILTPAPGREDAMTAAWQRGLTGVSSGHAAQLSAVLDALDAGEDVPVSTADARLTMELVAAIYASAFTGKHVARGELQPESPFYTHMAGSGAPWRAHKSEPVATGSA